MTYDFDRFLRYDEMATWLRTLAAAHPTLLTIESYGQSHLGRDLLVATITDSTTGEHHTKPAHWIDANIHATEVTGGVAALYIIHHLVTKHVAGDATVREALRTRTFYIAPRVNPDGVEDALLDRPLFHRSSVRSWPWRDGHRWPGLHMQDIDGDGRILTMRIADDDGGWMQHPDEPRVMIAVGPLGAPAGVQRYRLLAEGLIENYDGFTVDQPRDPAGLDGPVIGARRHLGLYAYRVSALRRLAACVTPVEGAAVLLHAVFEASHAELAQATGRTEAASRQQLRRALQRLRQARECDKARHGDGRDEPKDADPAVLRLYLQSLQSRDAQGLWALLRQPPVSALAIHGAVHAVLPLHHKARRPRATAGGVVQVGGQLGLVLTLDGVTLCVLPLGPCAELAHEGVVA